MHSGFAFLLMLGSLSAAVPLIAIEKPHPATGLKPGEKLHFEIVRFDLHGRSASTQPARVRNLYLQFNFCHWQIGRKQCRPLLKTPAWPLSAKSTQVAKLDFASRRPAFEIADETLAVAAGAIRAEHETALEVELRNEHWQGRIGGQVYVPLPLRRAQWNPTNDGQRPIRFAWEAFSIAGDHAAVEFSATVLDGKGEYGEP